MGMRERIVFVLTNLVLGFGLCCPTSALATDRSVETILGELNRVKVPSYDPSKRDDQAYIREFTAQLRETTEKRADLILELYKVLPDHDRVPALLAERWSIRPFALPQDTLLKEIDETLAHTENQRIKLEGRYAKTYAGLYGSRLEGRLNLSGVEEYIKRFPDDSRGATLLNLARGRTQDEKLQTHLEDQILSKYPLTSFAEKIRGRRDQSGRIGKPFELEFNDAITEAAVSIKGFKGKVVVIDFWATWCIPCVAEMPRMKELYAKYHDKGIEFIGVSLDLPEEQGGLTNLKRFVKEKEIAWPQYYQGNGWDSKFSVSCGINAIPAVFVIDREGKLYATNARENLDAMLRGVVENIEPSRK